MSLLKTIEINNFKTYKGHTVINAGKPFTAIVGPNGSGKSNLMDAISFVMGEETQNLRVNNLSDLIHGAAINQPVSTSTSVGAVFSSNDPADPEKKITFKRTIRGSASEYLINENVVTVNEYLKELEKLKINVKTKSFLVYQGVIESIALKDVKEMTAMFEEISGSRAFKSEYERLNDQLRKAKNVVTFAFKEKMMINTENKQLKLQKEEADKYIQLKTDLDEKLVEYYLFLGFHNEKAIDSKKEELTAKISELQNIKTNKCKLEQEHGKYKRELARIEQTIREIEVEVTKKKLNLIKFTEMETHVQKKIDTANQTLSEAKKTNEAHIDDIKKLETELAAVNKSKKEYEEKFVEESLSQGRDIFLQRSQLQEFDRLRATASKKSLSFIQELDSLNRDQAADQDSLDNISFLRTTAKDKHTVKCHEKEEMEKCVQKLKEYIQTNEETCGIQTELLKDLKTHMERCKNRVQQLEIELDDVLEQHGDAESDKYEAIDKRKNNVERLKAKYAGVFDRLVNMCHPIHERYKVAITKVLGKYLDAIIVDTEDTARNCITYLKNEMLSRETFLPLSYLTIKPINEFFRNNLPHDVKLVYDLIKFEPDTIAKAVMFATDNALVCETMEDAVKVAYDSPEGKYDVVALDGTYFRKSGIVSGGNFDLQKRAKRWDEKHLSQLVAKKEKLIDELKEIKKSLRKESELFTIESQISGIKTRVRYAEHDMDETRKKIVTVDKEVAKLNEKLTKLDLKMKKLEEQMQSRELKMEKLRLKMNEIEDVVFGDFCKKINVRNIREYENTEFRVQQARKLKRLELQQQIERITNSLDFEKKRDTQSNIDRWENIIEKEKENLKSIQTNKIQQQDEIDRIIMILDEYKTQKVLKNNEEVELQKEIATVARTSKIIQQSILSIKFEIENLQNVMRNILLECKLANVNILLEAGNIDNILSDSSTLQDVIKFNYDTLNDSLKHLDENAETKKEELLSAITLLKTTIQSASTPNLKAADTLEQRESEFQALNEKLADYQEQLNRANRAFDEIKLLRYEKFSVFYNYIEKEIDIIYKMLLKNQAARAYIKARNSIEPYLDGISYYCVVPGKILQPIDYLSGGEKTVAALALLFAIHRYNKTPFIVLDEIDAALDNTNVAKVVEFIQAASKDLQIISISLKEEFYAKADILVGIASKPGQKHVSEVFTVDLSFCEE